MKTETNINSKAVITQQADKIFKIQNEFHISNNFKNYNEYLLLEQVVINGFLASECCWLMAIFSNTK